MHIQEHVNSALLQTKGPSITYTNEFPTSTHAHSTGYFGEVSDIHFFNIAKQTFRGNSKQPDQADELIDNYDQDVYPQSSCSNDQLEDVSIQHQTDIFLEAYFTTIHIAYPFIPKSSFLRKYRSLPECRSRVRLDSSWLAQFCELQRTFPGISAQLY